MTQALDTTPVLSISQLQQHFDAQRDNAVQLIEQQNKLLSSLFSNQSNFGDVNNSVLQKNEVVTSVKAGNVVSLFDYADQKKGGGSAGESVNNAFNAFDESDVDALAKWGEVVSNLLLTYGADDALAVKRKQMATSIFLSSSLNGMFYYKTQFDILFSVCYVGTDEAYFPALEELKMYACQNNLQVNLMVHENRVNDLKVCDFSTTPIGIWQRIEPVSEFTLAGSSMRRLRYLVNKYIKIGNCETVEYKIGSDSKTDKLICSVIDEWCELKETEPAYIPEVKERILAGGYNDDHRFFLTYRDEALDNVMVFSRDNMNDGYLMDLEFYAQGLPLGSTEFALSEIIKCFTEEGRKVASLGLTMGTGLHEHDNESKEVAGLFASLKKAEYLNGDANAQYKNKYRPITTTMYLARPKDSGNAKLNDLMLLLGEG